MTLGGYDWGRCVAFMDVGLDDVGDDVAARVFDDGVA